VMVSVTAIFANVVLSLVLVNAFGFRGLALATSIAAILNGGILVLALRSRLNGIDEQRLLMVLVKVTFAALIMAVTAWAINAAMTSAIPGSIVLLRTVRLAAAIVGGLVVLAVSAFWLRLEEFDDLTAAFRARIPRVVRFGSR